MAPITGRISNHQVSIGNLVTGNESRTTTLLTTIVSLDPIYFNFDLSEADNLAYQRATARGALRSTRDNSIAVSLHLSDEKGWPHAGRMDFVDNHVDRSSGTIRARAVFANPDCCSRGAVRAHPHPGLRALQGHPDPRQRCVTDQSRKIVLTVNDDNVVVPKVVRPGPIAMTGFESSVADFCRATGSSSTV